MLGTWGAEATPRRICICPVRYFRCKHVRLTLSWFFDWIYWSCRYCKYKTQINRHEGWSVASNSQKHWLFRHLELRVIQINSPVCLRWQAAFLQPSTALGWWLWRSYFLRWLGSTSPLWQGTPFSAFPGSANGCPVPPAGGPAALISASPPLPPLSQTFSYLIWRLSFTPSSRAISNGEMSHPSYCQKRKSPFHPLFSVNWEF